MTREESEAITRRMVEEIATTIFLAHEGCKVSPVEESGNATDDDDMWSFTVTQDGREYHVEVTGPWADED